jgi:cytochrome b subunit of formate dehydrogenase
MLLPIDLVEVIMVAVIAIVGVIMWRAVTAPP